MQSSAFLLCSLPNIATFLPEVLLLPHYSESAAVRKPRPMIEKLRDKFTTFRSDWVHDTNIIVFSRMYTGASDNTGIFEGTL